MSRPQVNAIFLSHTGLDKLSDESALTLTRFLKSYKARSIYVLVSNIPDLRQLSPSKRALLAQITKVWTKGTMVYYVSDTGLSSHWGLPWTIHQGISSRFLCLYGSGLDLSHTSCPLNRLLHVLLVPFIDRWIYQRGIRFIHRLKRTGRVFQFQQQVLNLARKHEVICGNLPPVVTEFGNVQCLSAGSAGIHRTVLVEHLTGEFEILELKDEIRRCVNERLSDENLRTC